MILTLLLFFFSTFGLVAAGVISYRFVMERRALTGPVDSGAEPDVSWVEASELLKTDSLSSISFWDQLLAKFDYVEIIKVRIAEAGLKWTVGRLTSLMLLLGSLAFAALVNLDGVPWWLILGASAFAGATPYLYVLRLRRSRMLKMELQFPDALDSLARALRAGHPLSAGLQMMVYEMPEPLASEFRLTVDERALGGSWDQALDNLANRAPLEEVNTFVAAVKVQNKTGGKLSEVLGRLAETMRESAALKGEVRAIAAHGRMTGLVLTILPLIIAAVMLVVNPYYLALLWTRPSGQTMIAAALACLVLAHFVIRKMVDIRI